jgi:hypothetical protein
MQFSSVPSYLLFHSPKDLPINQPIFFLKCDRPVLHPYTTGKLRFFVLIFMPFDNKRQDKRFYNEL